MYVDYKLETHVIKFFYDQLSSFFQIIFNFAYLGTFNNLKLSIPYFWFPDEISPTKSPRIFFFSFVFLQLCCFGLQLASLALGLRTLVGTGSSSTASKELPASLFFLHNSKNKNRKNLKFVFLQLCCFGLQPASLELGLRTLV